MSGQTSSFRTSWRVEQDADFSLLRVRVPATRGDDPPPEFLRLDVRRPGVRGRLAPRPVLRSSVAAGSPDEHLTVSTSLKLPIGTGPVSVEKASESACRWYRLSRSAGSLFSAAASVIGALLVALGALDTGSSMGKGLLIAGIVLTVLAAVAMVVSAWRAPIE